MSIFASRRGKIGSSHPYPIIDRVPSVGGGPFFAPADPCLGVPRRAVVEKVGQIIDVMRGDRVLAQPCCSLHLRLWQPMSAPDPRIAEYGRQLFARLGERALSVARDMIAHLIAIGDRERADDWHHIFAAIEDARREPATAHAAEKSGPASPADLWLRTLKELEEIGSRRRGTAAAVGAEAPGNAGNNRPIVERGEAPTN